MQFSTSTKRLDAYLKNPQVDRAGANSPHGKRGFARFLLRFSEEQALRVIDAYIHQEGPTRVDPIERSAEHAAVFQEVEQQLQSLYPKRRRGDAHQVWRQKKKLLGSRGIDWVSPAELNPFHRFD